MTTTNTVDAARVELLLNELRLPGIRLMWAKLAEQSDREGWPAARFLAALAEHEMADRGRRRIERHLTEGLLPLHATVRQALDRYLIDRRKVSTADRALFISAGGRSLPYNTVRNVFLQLLDRIGLRGAHSGRDPRIHDLRHSFAVRSLEQCSHDRSAVARHIVALSTYLGHAHVTDTYWYLQATPVLMGQIAEAGEALLAGGIA
jgi:integrase